MFITKKSLPRRTFLKGVGTVLALPMLDAMVPALTAQSTAAVSPRRVGYLYIPNGVNQARWVPEQTGTGFSFSQTLLPLEPHREHVTVVSGLKHANAYSLGDGPGDHARASAVWLSGARAKRTEGEDVRTGTTADQMAAQHIGQDTMLPSLELALESTALLGICDAGYSCTYMNTISWRTPTTPLPMEVNPRVTFERLFGEGGSPESRSARIRRDLSILDSITAEATRLTQTLGARDKARMSEYLENVREIERQIQRAERQSTTSVALPDAPIGVPESYEEHADLTFEMLKVAFQADLTRVFSLMLAHEVSDRSYPQVGVPDAHHGVSHHQGDGEKLAKFAAINTYHVYLFAKLLERLKSTPEGDGSLLDHSTLVYGGGLGDGNAHDHSGLPALLAGGGGRTIKGGQHIAAKDAPMCNLLLTSLHSAGVPVENFGDSSGLITA